MNDYLGNLAAKNLGQAAVIQPRLASLFEPTRPTAEHASLESVMNQSGLSEAPSGDSSPVEPVHRARPASEPVPDTPAPSPGRPSITRGTQSSERPAQPFAPAPPPPAHRWSQPSVAAGGHVQEAKAGPFTSPPITPAPTQPPTRPARPPLMPTASAQPEEVMGEAAEESPAHMEPTAARAAFSKALDDFDRTSPAPLVGGHAANIEMPHDMAMSRRGPTLAPVRQTILAEPAAPPGEESPPIIPSSEQRAAASPPASARQAVRPAVRPAAREQPVEPIVSAEEPELSSVVPTARPGAIAPSVPPTRTMKDQFVAEQRRGTPAPQQAPTVHVTIGRIEVRATPPPVPPPKQRTTPPVMSLDDYLRQRDGGRR